MKIRHVTVAVFALTSLLFSTQSAAYDRCHMEAASATTSRCFIPNMNITLTCDGSEDKPTGICHTQNGEPVECILKEVGLREPRSTWCEISLTSAHSDTPTVTAYPVQPNPRRSSENVAPSPDTTARVLEQLKYDRAARADIMAMARQVAPRGANRAAAVLRGMGATVGHDTSMSFQEQ